MAIQWLYFPKAQDAPDLGRRVVAAFHAVEEEICSDAKALSSDQVLDHVRPGLESLGFAVERGKKKEERIDVPVLFGINGRPEKTFQADAHHRQAGYVVEVEAGRAVVNNQFLKDLFQACMMHNVSTLVLAVRNRYRNSNDFERVCRFFETLYTSQRLTLPLQGILVVGY